jgi:alpha-glucosidase
VGNDLKEVHKKAIGKFYSKPTEAPDALMTLRPFFSTWAEHKTEVNQTVVLEYARRIISEGFELSSHIEIDDHWESCYGEREFNLNKFPDPKAMVDEIKAMNLRLTMWVHPFINYDCPSFKEGVDKQYFVKDGKGKPGITSWWQGAYAGIIDYTNNDAVNWWNTALDKLRTDYGVDSYKFDAGETNWLPYSSKFGDEHNQPNIYTTKYVEAVAAYGGMVEVRSGRRNQNLPIFTRMLDKDSRWGYDNGLKSLIPTLLHFGLLGYPFVLPDMIGGNAYNGRPSGELYVRWMQANTFMPAVQFSLVPWNYDAQVVQLTKDALTLRENYKTVLEKAVAQALIDGSPVNRPMWWVDPNDSATYTIDDQYMLGDDILVAPVVEEGAVTRDIYLPTGMWESHDGVNYIGPTRLTAYPAPLQTLPFFVKK